jgi:hypothetical protein
LRVVKFYLGVSHSPLRLTHTIRYPGEGRVNLLIIIIGMVTDGVLFSYIMDWNVLQSKQNGTKNRSLRHTKKKEDSNIAYDRNRNRLATTREIRFKLGADRARQVKAAHKPVG